MVGGEGPGQGAAVERLQDRRLDLDEAVLVEPAADLADRAGAQGEETAALLVGDQVQLAPAVAGLDVLEAVELVRRRTQALGEQSPAVDRQRELAAAPGRHRRPLDADDVAEVEVDEQLVRPPAPSRSSRAWSWIWPLPSRRSRKQALPWPRRATMPPGDPVRETRSRSPAPAPRGRPAPRRCPRARRTRAETGRSPPRAFAPASPACRRGRRRALALRSRSSERAYRPLSRLDLGDFQFLLRPARNLDGDHVVALAADQRFADRRLVGELVLERVGLGRADDLEFLRVAGLLVLDVDDRAELDLVGAERPSRRSPWRGAAAPRAGRSAARAGPARSWRRRTRRSRRCRRTRAPL